MSWARGHQWSHSLGCVCFGRSGYLWPGDKPELCILNVRSTLWELWNAFDSGLRLETLFSVRAKHKHLLISKCHELISHWPWIGASPTPPLSLLWRFSQSATVSHFLEQSMEHILHRKFQYNWTRELDQNTVSALCYYRVIGVGFKFYNSGKLLGNSQSENGNEVLELAMQSRLNCLRIFLSEECVRL